MALLNQMVLPSAIGVELKLMSIALDAVQALSVAEAEETMAPAEEAGLATDEPLPADRDEGAETETAPSTFRTLGNLRPTPCARSAAHTNPRTTYKRFLVGRFIPSSLFVPSGRGFPTKDCAIHYGLCNPKSARGARLSS